MGKTSPAQAVAPGRKTCQCIDTPRLHLFFHAWPPTRDELLCFTAWRTKTSETRGKPSYTPLFCWDMCHNNEKFNYLENYPLLIKLKVKSLPTSPPLRPRWFLLPVPASEGQLTLNLEPYRFTQFPIIPSNNL